MMRLYGAVFLLAISVTAAWGGDQPNVNFGEFRHEYSKDSVYVAGPKRSMADVPSFFPERPDDARLYQMEGILINYGNGNKSGGLTIKDKKSGKTYSFFTGYPMRMNGRIANCADEFCPDWPKEIRLEHTKVRVTYWVDDFDGEKVPVSDQIDSVK